MWRSFSDYNVCDNYNALLYNNNALLYNNNASLYNNIIIIIKVS